MKAEWMCNDHGYVFPAFKSCPKCPKAPAPEAATPPDTGDLDERKAFESWWHTVGQTIGEVAAWEAWKARSRLPLQPKANTGEAP